MKWRSNLLGRTSALRSLSGDLWDPELPEMACHVLFSVALSMGLLSSCMPMTERVELVPDSTISSATAPVTLTPAVTPLSEPTTARPAALLAPTLDPTDVQNLVGAAHSALDAREVSPLCLQWQDVSNDGHSEWVGLYMRPTDPPRLAGFVLDGEAWYELEPSTQEEYGLGEYPTCRLEVRDVNTDGQVEIIIWGYAATNIELLHIFRWDGVRYGEVASFWADAGVKMADVDGTLSDEIIVRHNVGGGLAWESIHAWDGSDYAWIWERYQWLHADYPHTYLSETPSHVVISFYLAVDGRDLPGAYRFLSSEAQMARPYRVWAEALETSLAVEVGSVREMDRTERRATVTAQVRSYDNLDGWIIGRLWDVTWLTIVEGDTWRLDEVETTELSRWQAPYYR